MRLLDMYNWQL